MSIEYKTENKSSVGYGGITDPELAKIFGRRASVPEDKPEIKSAIPVEEKQKNTVASRRNTTDREIRSVFDLFPDFDVCRKTVKEKKLKGMKKALVYWKALFHRENIKRVTCLFIPCFLFFMLFLNIVTPASDVSEKENRALAQFPEISMETIKNGQFMSGFEDYISDQFVFRNHFVSSKLSYEMLSGKKSNHGILLCDDGYLIENSSELKDDNTDENIEAINVISSVGRYNVTVAVVPTAYDVLKDKLPAYSYEDTYTGLQNKLTSSLKNAVVVDAKPELDKYKDKYIYYRSDHHQTALGSYVTYSALAESLGFRPYPVERFKVTAMSEDFYGTAWSNSGFADTQKDIIYKYSLQKEKKCTVEFPLDDKKMDSLYSDEMLTGKDKYAYYLDGNHAIAEIKTGSDGGRLAIIKDSYAHSIVPFLANHYSYIYLIDPRYYNGDVFEYLYENNIKDVLILYNHNTFVTDGNLSKITEFSKVSAFTSVPDISYGIVPELEVVDPSYFDNAVFVGDSLTIGIQNFSGFNSEFLCAGGLNTETLETLILDNGMTVIETIEEMEHIGKIYIMLGTNEVAFDDMSLFLTRYSGFIDKVRKKFPNVIVYIESIMPVTNDTSETTGITNESITLYNEQLLEMAKTKGCYYVDCHSYFEGPDGALPDDIGSDGIHLGPEKYKEFADYLCAHAVPEFGVSAVGSEKKKVFAGGGKLDTVSVGENILDKIEFKDSLAKVADSILISNYKIDASQVCSGALYLGGGATAEEIAVFEAKSESAANKIEKLAKDRVERKKDDFRNYIPAEMTKLNNPVIVRKGKVVAVCIADEVNDKEILKLIK